MPYVLDTGVLLRLFDRSDPSHVAIRQAVIRLKVRGERLVTTAQWKLLVSNYRILGVSVHDARIATLMIRHELTHLVTLNVDDFRRFSGIVPVTPEELLASLKAP